MFSRFTAFFCAVLLAPLAAAEAVVSIEDAWVRALPPIQKTTAAYLVLHNHGAVPLQVVGASVTGAGRVEIHTSSEVDGLLRMEQLTTLEVPAGERYSFAPGATHLMLFDLEAMPAPGQTRKLCLAFAAAEQVCVEAQVRKRAQAANEHHHHHH